ncbi:DUF5667 domain-containing protein [Microbacteriaceae bacterium 4G12]
MKKWLVAGVLSTMLVGTFTAGTAAYASDGNTKTEKPALVEGDFFYFVKTMKEQIRLALAKKDLDKAKVLSELAAERIAEAQVLIEQGKDNLVQDTLHKAAENLDKADGLSDTKNSSKTEASKVKVHVGNNIEALAKVLDKVKNPKAKQAIAKNIEKSFAKLANQIEKEQQKDMKQENGALTVVEEGTKNEQPSVPVQADTEKVEKVVSDKQDDETDKLSVVEQPKQKPAQPVQVHKESQEDKDAQQNDEQDKHKEKKELHEKQKEEKKALHNKQKEEKDANKDKH